MNLSLFLSASNRPVASRFLSTDADPRSDRGERRASDLPVASSFPSTDADPRSHRGERRASTRPVASSSLSTDADPRSDGGERPTPPRFDSDSVGIWFIWIRGLDRSKSASSFQTWTMSLHGFTLRHPQACSVRGQHAAAGGDKAVHGQSAHQSPALRGPGTAREDQAGVPDLRSAVRPGGAQAVALRRSRLRGVRGQHLSRASPQPRLQTQGPARPGQRTRHGRARGERAGSDAVPSPSLLPGGEERRSSVLRPLHPRLSQQDLRRVQAE
ncbi:uncharacterized protein LOC134303957 isoform X2 [Trichomycterus rosablanca]|uniref:uncharacterized protein LOC134303957 isoform X2 n=1 Tax=Trichomycterus rosablanca TaxID=2290929 RepID=UPI002F3558D8